MKFFTTFVTTALAVVGAFAQSGRMTINTPPNLPTCRPYKFTWTGGQPPYYLTIRIPAQPNTQPLVEFAKQNSNELTWLVNLPSNSFCILNLQDADGLLAQSGTFSIDASTTTDSNCTTQPLSYSAGPTATSSGSLSGAVPTKGSNTTSDALTIFPFHIGTGAVIGALALGLAA